MKLYQVEHYNCEKYEDAYYYREDKVYTDKDTLLNILKEQGYEEKVDSSSEGEEVYYYKDNVEDMPLYREDLVTIHEIEVIEEDK